MNPLLKTALFWIITTVGLCVQAGDDIIVADFEGKDYGNWKVTGEAFGPGPAQGTLPGQMTVGGFQGHGLVNSFFHGDDTTGTLTSPPFKIERPYIRFLIGGGKNPDKTCMNLLVDGQVVRSATGPNDKAGGSEQLVADSWNVQDLIGKVAVVQIVDQAAGGWGHICVDDIAQTDHKPPGMLSNAKRPFFINQRYLNLPIKNGGPHRKVSISVTNGSEKQTLDLAKAIAQFGEGGLPVTNDIELADGEPDWWAPIDLSAYQGQTVIVEVDKIPENSTALSAIEPGNQIKGAEGLYHEPLRNQFHFSPKRGWNNDPNGMVLYRGEYHLFFQHNPYGWNWGNMHWGHAISRDMVHWTELGDVLAPDKFGPMFSGSAVVDWANTSGFGKPGNPAQVLLYTAAGDPTVQCLAFSTDGRHYHKYPDNPVVPQFTGGNRDPKVIWHEPTKKWVMTLYVETNRINTIHFLSSPDLKHWSLMSTVDGFFECPDFFELPVGGDSAHKKWVLTAASSEYMVGTFDGTRFTPETPKLKGHLGKGFYAAQTFSDIPAKDGRRIQIGWFQTETKGMPFNQSMTVPLELKLTSTSEGPRLTWTPVKELEKLRRYTHRYSPITLSEGAPNPLAKENIELVELRAEFVPNSTGSVTFTVRGATLVYDSRKRELTVNRLTVPAPLVGGQKQNLSVYCDRSGMEVFASGGRTYVPMPYIPKADDRKLAVQVTGGAVSFSQLTAYELKSAW